MRRAAHCLSLFLALAIFSPALATAQGLQPTVGQPAAGAPLPPAPGPAPTVHVAIQNEAGVPVTAVLTGGRLRVAGTVRPYIGGQTVVVRTSRPELKLEAREASIVSIGNGAGYFTTMIGVGGKAARISVEVTHDATTLEPAFAVPVRHIHAVSAHVSPGRRSVAAALLQQELAGMHFAVSQSGAFDGSTQRAVIAYRKLSNLTRTSEANRLVFERLAAGHGAFKVRFPGQGAHFEGDLTHQVLAEVMPGGKVRRIYEMSSGKPSTPTVIGNFSIYSKTLGTNAKGMVDANYFIRGYAIHGYYDVPVYAASHGCLRIPIPDAAAVFEWAQYGYPVDVYYRSGGGSTKVRGNAGP